MAIFGLGKKNKDKSKDKSVDNAPSLDDAIIHDSKDNSNTGLNFGQDKSTKGVNSGALQDNSQGLDGLTSQNPAEQNQQAPQSPNINPQNQDGLSSSPLGEQNDVGQDSPDVESFEKQFNNLLQGAGGEEPESGGEHPLKTPTQTQPQESVQQSQKAINNNADNNNNANYNNYNNQVQPLQNSAADASTSQAGTQNAQTQVRSDTASPATQGTKGDSFFDEFNELPDVMEAPKNKNVNVKVKGDVDLNGTNYTPESQKPDYSDLKEAPKPEPAPQPQPEEKPAEPKVKKPRFIKRIINGKAELFTEVSDLRTVYESFDILNDTSDSMLQSLKALDRMHDVEESTIEHFKNYFEELQQDLKTIDHLLFEDFEGEK